MTISNAQLCSKLILNEYHCEDPWIRWWYDKYILLYTYQKSHKAKLIYLQHYPGEKCYLKEKQDITGHPLKQTNTFPPPSTPIYPPPASSFTQILKLISTHKSNERLNLNHKHLPFIQVWH